MNKILILLIAAFGCGCSTLPEQYSQAPSRSLVEGVSTEDATEVTRVEIGNVDGNPLPVSGDYQHLTKRIWLKPGVHKLFVMCRTSYSWGAIMVGTKVDIDVQPGFNYLLTSSVLKSESDKPRVEITKKAIK